MTEHGDSSAPGMAAATAGIGHHVRVAGAVKRYGGATALAGISVDIEPGRFVVLLGPSGSGKSTLLRSIAGVERIDAGAIYFGDRLVSAPNKSVAPERRNLAMVFQDYALWPHLTALGNVSYALRRRHLDRTDAMRQARDALSQVGLAELAGRYPHELSGGEQQRVGLARAVVARPALLLFDEPLSNLDADLRERLRVEIATLSRASGATVIYITHDQSEAFALADDIGILNRGTIEQVGSPEEIYNRPATPFVARFTGMSAQLSGTVAQMRHGTVVVRVGSHQIAARAGATMRPGDTATIVIRPAATTLTRTSVEATIGLLSGTVIDTAYRGRGYDHVVDVGAGTLTAIFDPAPWTRGTECGVHVDPEACTAFPVDDSTGSDLTAVRIEDEQCSPLSDKLEVGRP